MGIHPTIEVSVLGMWDTMWLMALALVVFGPQRLPKIGRQIGKLMYEFRKASNDFKFQMEEELRNAEEADRRKREEQERQRVQAAAPQAQIAAVSQAPAGTEAAPTTVDGMLDTTTVAADGSAYADGTAYVDGSAYYAGSPERPGYYDAGPMDAAEAEAEETRLRVHPPATGAPVAAEKPTSRAVELGNAQAGMQSGAAEETVAGVDARAEQIAAAEESAGTGAAAEKNAAADKASGEAGGEASHASSDVSSGDTEPAAHHG